MLLDRWLGWTKVGYMKSAILSMFIYLFLFNFYLTRQVRYEQILIYNDGLPKGKRPHAWTVAGIKIKNKYRTKHTSRHERQHNTT
jgi:hypothetical protein